MVDVKTQAVATAIFKTDGSITVKLTSAAGITARKLDRMLHLLLQELQRLRAVERRLDSINQAEAQRIADEKEKAASKDKGDVCQTTT